MRRLGGGESARGVLRYSGRRPGRLRVLCSYEILDGTLPMPVLSFEDKREAINRVIGAKFGDLYNWWIVATFDESVIVSKGDDHFRILYTFNEDDDVTLGTETKVEITYTPVTEGRTAILCPLLSEGQEEADGSRWQSVLIEEGLAWEIPLSR